MPDFACEILTPYRRFFSGRAESVILAINDGQIQILADHEPIVAPVRIGQLRIVTDGVEKRAALTDGFIRVKSGRVDIFVDAAEWPEEIDKERAAQALGRAVKRLSTETLAWRIESSKRAKARAQNRIAVAEGEPAAPPPAEL